MFQPAFVDPNFEEVALVSLASLIFLLAAPVSLVGGHIPILLAFLISRLEEAILVSLVAQALP